MSDLMSCAVCHGSYNLDTIIPKVLRCGHTHCVVCIKKIKIVDGAIRCPMCNKWSNCGDKNENTFPTNFALMQILEQRKTENGERSFKCAECEVSGKVTEQYICTTCVQTKYHLVNVTEEIDKIPEGIEALVLCASCAIRNHCQKKHETTELTALKLDFEFHQNMRDVKTLRTHLTSDNQKLKRRVTETHLLLDSCRLECEHAATVIKDSKSHRNHALAMPCLKKSFEALRNTYSYCNIKLTEVNARLIEGIPREALNLLEHKPGEYKFPKVRVEPITGAMKFRVPNLFPVDQNIQATDADEAESHRSPSPGDELNEYDSDVDSDDYLDIDHSPPPRIESATASDSDEAFYLRLDQRESGFYPAWNSLFDGPLAEPLAGLRDAGLPFPVGQDQVPPAAAEVTVGAAGDRGARRRRRRRNRAPY